MMHLSLTTGYAIRALGCLEEARGHWVRVKELVAHTGAPRAYLVKLLHRLSKSGVIQTKRGYQGGYTLRQSSEEISLLVIAEAVEGKNWLSRCLLGYEVCTDKRDCPVHEFWKKKRVLIGKELSRMTLKDVVRFENGKKRRPFRRNRVEANPAHEVEKQGQRASPPRGQGSAP